jgi:hypothetical protein
MEVQRRRVRTEVGVDVVVGAADGLAADGARHPLRAGAGAPSWRRGSISRLARHRVVGLGGNGETLSVGWDSSLGFSQS